MKRHGVMGKPTPMRDKSAVIATINNSIVDNMALPGFLDSRMAVATDDGIRKRKDSLLEKEMDNIVDDLEKETAENKGPETKWRKARLAIRDWGESSSCHGIPHMAQASTFCAAIVWSVILAFCAVGFVYFFTDTLSQYLRFDKIVQLNIGLEAASFPSVTFCNINPYKKSKIQQVPALQALLTVYESSAKGGLSS